MEEGLTIAVDSATHFAETATMELALFAGAKSRMVGSTAEWQLPQLPKVVIKQ